MKSMKKMLCLLLVAMLLVAAIPVAAGAQEIPSFEQAAEEPVAQQPAAQQPAARTVTTLAEPDVPSDVGQAEVNYTVLFAVENPGYAGTPKYALSTAIAVFSVASDANADTIRAAAAGAVAKAGYSSVTADSIVSRVSANGGAALVHNVRYGSIRTDAQSDGAGNKFIYTLSVSARPEEVNADETVQAKILLDKENTGKFEDTGKTVPVTLVKTTYGTTVTYSMKSNGGATIDDIKGVLGANYKNKTLSMTVQGPSANNGEVTYRVTVKGDSGSTGTNIPTYDGTGSNNNGGNNIGSGSTGSNIPGYNPGSGSSNNGGSGSTGSGSNSGNAGNYDFTTPKTLMICYGDRVFTRKVSSASEFEAAKADAIAEMQRYGYTFKGWK